MSTRRARIKAVTSLPPRRKNNADKTNTSVPKDEVEKALKSPKTPRNSLKSQGSFGRNSPIAKKESPLKSPRGVNITLPQRISSPAPQKEALKDIAVTPKTSEKVLSNKPVFISPRNVSSPIRKPAIQTPTATLIEQDEQKQNTLEKPISSSICKKNTNVEDDNSEKTRTLPTTVNTAEPKNVASDDYNVPSVPESITEDSMDGIVPLKAAACAPKPIALLNEIISENAEVLFDPIVPLPSPSKVRPKLRPVPRLNPMRRNSVQGSASESEDESRRAHLNAGSGTPAPPVRPRTESHTSLSTMVSLPNRDVTRVRNDSVCSSVSQVAVPLPIPASPVKEKTISKPRRQDTSRRMGATRRRRETAKSDVLTMYDLIFYNPTTNPIIPDEDELKAKEANENMEAIRRSEPEENPDDPPPSDAAPVPQIKLGANGEIILDDQSLVIKQSANRKVSNSVVVEGSWSGLGSGRYKRGTRSAEWSSAETVRFYRALAALGTDFTLMERLFPDRTRRELKLKFKKEERVNGAQVDMALRTMSKWDATKLEEEFRAERDAVKRRARHDAERLRQRARDERSRHKTAKELRMRQSKASKAMESSILPGFDPGDKGLTADDIIRRHHEAEIEARNQKRADSISTVATNPPPPRFTTSPFAQLTLANSQVEGRRTPTAGGDLATVIRIDTPRTAKTPELFNSASGVPSNIEPGSLVVFTVDDPKCPTKKMLQTYIANGVKGLVPVALPPNLLNSVVSYMKKGTPKSTVSGASSPSSSVISQDSRSTTPNVIIASPAKRKRHSSYTMTQL